MLWSMTCRVIVSVVTFFIGFTVFQVARPTEEHPAPKPAAQILAITLKRHGCSDAERKCPVYEATFRSDGTSSYIGYANDNFIGKYEGTYDPKDFVYLVEQIEQQGFFELTSAFPTGPVEETTGLEVVTSEGVKLVTTNNWSSTPSGLRALQAMIEQQTYEAEWEEVD
jgi:hypothetical protein